MNFEDRTDFIAIVNSNDSLEYFPDNCSSEFRNQLSVPINAQTGQLYVAINELFYTDNFTPFDETVVVEKIEPVTVADLTQPETRSFFRSGTEDNVVNTFRYQEIVHSFVKDSAGILTYVTKISTQLQQYSAGYSVSLIQIGTAGVFTIEINFVDQSGKYNLKLSQRLADILGFTKLDFKPGKYLGDKSVNEDAFAKLSIGGSTSLKVFHYATKNVQVQEPEEYDVEELFQNISHALNEEKFDVGLVLLPNDNEHVLKVAIRTSGLFFRISSEITKLLGLTVGFTFQEKMSDIILPNALFPTEKVVVIPDETVISQEGRKRNLLVVHTNIIEPQRFGGTFAQALRVSRRQKSINTEINLKFQPLVFVPLQKLDLSSIQIRLTDEFFNPLPNSNAPTTAVLQFIQKY